jgi:hypothetical protein
VSENPNFIGDFSLVDIVNGDGIEKKMKYGLQFEK